jgi:hypothetical protein
MERRRRAKTAERELLISFFISFPFMEGERHFFRDIEFI